MPEPPEPSIYQLRSVMLGISPIIWRRLLVKGGSTIADLHVTLQTAFGRSDDHLHRSLIRALSGKARKRDSGSLWARWRILPTTTGKCWSTCG